MKVFGTNTDELRFAEELARDEGDYMHEVFHGPKMLVVRRKPEGDVTDVDETVSDNVVAAYKHRGINVASEEKGGTATYGDRDIVIIDPTDGTRNMINGQKLSPRISLAMFALAVKRREVEVAVAYAPLLPTKVMYTAVKGQGAFREKAGFRRRLRIDDHPTTGVVLMSDTEPQITARLQAAGFETVILDGAVFKACCLIDPELLELYRPGELGSRQIVGFVSKNAYTHDFAATALLGAEAGCVVSSPTGGSLVFKPGKQGCVMSNNPVVHRKLLQAVRG
ncbi:MAG TPA: inositol monophosphatase family protein [Candidatus Saccharimonadales bacterium]